MAPFDFHMIDRGRLPSPGRFALWLLFSLLVLALDQWTKAWVTDAFVLGEFLAVTPFFNLCHVRNTGAAFSFLAGGGGWQIVLFSVIALAVILAALAGLWKANQHRWLALGLSLLIAGAAGNAADRLREGAVVDFLDFHWGLWHWPAFNVADIAVCAGAAFLVLHEILASRRGA